MIDFGHTVKVQTQIQIVSDLNFNFRKHSVQDSQSSRKSSNNEKTPAHHQSLRRISSSSSSSSTSSSQLDSFTTSRTPLGFDSLSPRKGSLVLDPLRPRRTADSRVLTCSPVHGEEEEVGYGGLRKASIIKDPASRKSSGLDSRKSSASQVREYSVHIVSTYTVMVRIYSIPCCCCASCFSLDDLNYRMNCTRMI